MRINLAKVVPFLGLVGHLPLLGRGPERRHRRGPDDGYDYGYDTPDTSRADAYLDRRRSSSPARASTSTRR